MVLFNLVDCIRRFVSVVEHNFVWVLRSESYSERWGNWKRHRV